MDNEIQKLSRVAKAPITIPSDVAVSLEGQEISVKGSKGVLRYVVHAFVAIKQEDAQLLFSVKVNANDMREANAQAGTARALVNNMIIGVSQGFEKVLELRGVGYNAVMDGARLELKVGTSHRVHYDIPEGIQITLPKPTLISIKGIVKQQVGQVAAEIRSVRPPEIYKGKGIRYSGEVIVLKEVSKK